METAGRAVEGLGAIGREPVGCLDEVVFRGDRLDRQQGRTILAILEAAVANCRRAEVAAVFSERRPTRGGSRGDRGARAQRTVCSTHLAPQRVVGVQGDVACWRAVQVVDRGRTVIYEPGIGAVEWLELRNRASSAV